MRLFLRHIGIGSKLCEIRTFPAINKRMSSKSTKRVGDGSISPPQPKRVVKQVSSTSSQAVASFFTPVSKKPPEKLSWRIVDSTLIAGRYNASVSDDKSISNDSKKKIAAFDFDSTIIKTISKLKFAKDVNDWCWWHGTVPGKLKELHQAGYLLVILSNQNGITLSKTSNAPKVLKADRFAQFKQKTAAVFNNLNLPISIYAATERDKFRKPSTGMWDELLKEHQLKIEDIDLLGSIFVGDAGGRQNDFSCSDRNFAANVGIIFKTPEEFFLEQPPAPFIRQFDPSTFLKSVESLAVASSLLFQPSTGQELALFVGSPGAGKSTFFQKHLKPLGYERVNQDTLKSREKCIAVATDFIKHGKSVAIDNTNPDKEVRKKWVSLAIKLNVPIRCFHFTASKELSKHNNLVRAISGDKEFNPESRTVLPELAFNSFLSRFQEPSSDEGFVEIIQVPFTFDGSEEARHTWSKYWY